jgi:glycosyltransferase involved in cell wall biosynthesis
MKFTISVVMPALDEEANIEAAINNTLSAFDDLGIDGEIVVVNDGSTDGTQEIAQGLMERHPHRIQTIQHQLPQGIGQSFWDGVGAARYEIVAMFPGDNENDPWEALRYLNLLADVDIVIPFVFNRQVRPLFRNVLSMLYRQIINTSFLVNLNYTNGTILYRKAVLKHLKFHSKSFFFQTDILVRLIKQGYLFAEVPYRLGLRSTGVSKAISWPSLGRVASGYLRLMRDMKSARQHLDPPDFEPQSATARRHAPNTSLKVS